MPSLSALEAVTAHSVIVYGAPKSGKTELVVGQLARHYKVIYVDLEKGRTTLNKLPDDLKQNIDVVAIKDDKDNPMAIAAAIKLAAGSKRTYCMTHQKLDCLACSKSKDPDVMATQFDYEFNSLNPAEYVVVFDSFTQIASSAKAHVGKDSSLRAGDMPKMNKFDHDKWAALGVLLERFLDYVQQAKFNVVCITHEMGIEQEDGIEKLMPSGGTKNFARTVAKYFDHIVYCSVKNKKHLATSSTTSENRIVSGSRTGVEVDTNDPNSMARLLGKKGLPAPTTGNASNKSGSKLLRK